jgi:type IV secretory pathway VirB6-like protein
VAVDGVETAQPDRASRADLELARVEQLEEPQVEIEDIPAATKPTGLPASSGRYMQIFERVTGVLAVCFLVAGLVVWKVHQPSQGRLALLILVCAMFLSILHYYSLEDTGNGKKPGVKL